MAKDWRDGRKFRNWARDRSQLEIHRAGWDHAGPWFTCTDPECPGRVEYGRDDHCYSVVEGHDSDGEYFGLHICTYVDVESKVMTILTIANHAADGTVDRVLHEGEGNVPVVGDTQAGTEQRQAARRGEPPRGAAAPPPARPPAFISPDRVARVNAYWYATPQFRREARWRWRCDVHNRHVGVAFRRRTAQRHAEEQCDDRCPLWEG